MKINLFGINPFSESLEQVIECRKGVAVPGINSVILGNNAHSELYQQLCNAYNASIECTANKPTDERSEDEMTAVSLEVDSGKISIRPTDNFDLVIRTDEMLQELYGPRMIPKIKFLNVSNPKYNSRLREHSLLWRVTTLPRTVDEVIESIESSHKTLDVGEGEHPIWYHSKNNGHNFVTYQDFSRLGRLSEEQLRMHMVRLADLSWHTFKIKEQTYKVRRANSNGCDELVFFMAGAEFDYKLLDVPNFATMEQNELNQRYTTMKDAFRLSISDREYLNDNLQSDKWRQAMFNCLTAPPKNLLDSDVEVSEELRLGLAPEFSRKIKWMPGLRLEKDGSVLPDPVIQAILANPDDDAFASINADTNLELQKVLVNRAGVNLRTINSGKFKALNDGSNHAAGRREKYLIEAEVIGSEIPEIWQVSMLRWGIWQYLEEGKSLRSPKAVDMNAFRIDDQEYLLYVQSRDIGLREMCLPELGVRKSHFETWAIHESHKGHDFISYALARKYVFGTATNRVDPEKFKDKDYAQAFLRLMAGDVAIDLVIGREDHSGAKLIDSGNSVIVEHKETGLPDKLKIIEIFGSFDEVNNPDLSRYGRACAMPFTRRYGYWYDNKDAGKTYAVALVDALYMLKEKVQRNMQAYALLFADQQLPERIGIRDHNIFDERNWALNSFGYKWIKVMKRILQTEPVKVGVEACAQMGLDPRDAYRSDRKVCTD